MRLSGTAFSYVVMEKGKVDRILALAERAGGKNR
jgi:hypothetical protein